MSIDYYVASIKPTSRVIALDALRVLLTHAQQGDTHARDEIVQAYAYTAFCAALKARLPDEDMDELSQVANMALLYAIDHARADDDDFNFTYYVAYCVRRSIEWHRKEEYRHTVFDGAPPASGTARSDNAPLKSAIVRALLVHLVPNQRRVIDWLYGITGEQYSGTEIAARMECSKQMVSINHKRAIKSLQRAAHTVAHPPQPKPVRVAKPAQPEHCTAPGCMSRVQAKGLCNKHYAIHRRTKVVYDAPNR